MLAREVGKNDQEDSFLARYAPGVLRTRIKVVSSPPNTESTISKCYLIYLQISYFHSAPGRIRTCDRRGSKS